MPRPASSWAERARHGAPAAPDWAPQVGVGLAGGPNTKSWSPFSLLFSFFPTFPSAHPLSVSIPTTRERKRKTSQTHNHREGDPSHLARHSQPRNLNLTNTQLPIFRLPTARSLRAPSASQHLNNSRDHPTTGQLVQPLHLRTYIQHYYLTG
ncbi:hypothetical protein VTJ04DRAFT_2676 [Mycothermus thermophilus]|uniref:uncharacterized protein n=1 Tax=Humicola insolens TaxID=85995 RepID=UPI003743D841